MLYTINYLLIGLVSVTALVIMAYWNRATGGQIKRCADGKRRLLGGWRDYSTGRSLMGLLGMIVVITGNAAVQSLVPKSVPLEARAAFYFCLYLVFIYTLVSIGLNIRSEVRRGRSKDAHPSTPTKESSHD